MTRCRSARAGRSEHRVSTRRDCRAHIRRGSGEPFSTMPASSCAYHPGGLMLLRFPSPVIGFVVALTSVAGCGGEEAFTLQLGTHEIVIERVASARLAHTDQGLEQPIVVGDLDGDGIDDAVVRTTFMEAPSGDGNTVFGGAVYVLYGGSAVTGAIDLAQLPAMVHVGSPSISTPPSGGIAAVGDMDGDGLADFVVSIDGYIGCVDPPSPFIIDTAPVAGVWVVYGSATRLTGSHEIKDVAARL